MTPRSADETHHRIALGISYRGSNYCGLQKLSQPSGINNLVETALARIADHPIRLYAAGRTDKGVHALQQVLHFDSQAVRSNHAWTAGGNAHLPDDIRIHWAQRTDSGFHARFSAQSRRYAYLIANGNHVDAAMHGLCHQFRTPLDVAAMQESCKGIQGEYDCNCFTRMAHATNKSSIRHIDWIRVESNPPWILIDIQANAFLQRMVRMLVAVLLETGRGTIPANRLRYLLTCPQQDHPKHAVPASGLFLTSIHYSPAWNLPLQAAEKLWPYRLVQ